MTKFIYQGKTYETWNLNKELKKMGISSSDIELIKEEDTSPFSPKWCEDNGYTFVGYYLDRTPCLLLKPPTDKTNYPNEFKTHKEYVEWFKNQ